MKVRKHRGGILLVVIVCISILGGVLLLLLENSVQRAFFHLEASRAYGFIDGQDKLHGLGEVEAESMRALTFALINNVAEKKKSMFPAVANSYSSPIQMTFEDLTKLAGVSMDQKKIEHSPQLEVKITLAPLDNKLPFIPKFKDEILYTLRKVLTVEKNVNKKRMDEFIAEVSQLLSDNSTQNVWNILGIDIFRQLPSWSSMVGKSAEQELLNKLAEHIVFSKDVRAVNFFAASSIVRESIGKVFRGDSDFNSQLFVFNKNGAFQMDGEAWRKNVDILDEIIAQNVACQDDPSYVVHDDSKVFLKQISPVKKTYSSHSRVIEISIEVIDLAFGRNDKRGQQLYKYTYIMPNGDPKIALATP
ncbi:MAG: hypothetical protein LBI56_03010 [Puniceicoccales bacterium]|jgi:endonuclease III|nr:hypothetical protein [Puniceicoccales bacterium]